MNEIVLEEARIKIASFFKNRRIELNLSQQDVADRAGLSRKSINALEGAKFWPSMKLYMQLCYALHLFPTVVEIEANDSMADALRSTWEPHDKAMTVDEALLKKGSKALNLDQNN